MTNICDGPGIRLTLSNENPATEDLLHVEFAIRTDIGIFQFSGEGDLAELCELVPTQIQNAGALYGLMKIFSEEEARRPTSTKPCWTIGIGCWKRSRREISG